MAKEKKTPRFIVVKDEYERLIKKYPSQKGYIIREIDRIGKCFNQIPQQFEYNKGKFFLEGIKEFIFFYDSQKPVEEIEEKAKESKIIWNEDLMNTEFPQEEWVIQDLIPRNSVGFLSGKRDSYKSFLAQYIAYCIASGTDFLGFKTNKVKNVLYLSLENGERLMKERGKMILNGLNHIRVRNVGWLYDLRLDNDEDMKELRRDIEKYDIDFIIIDSFRRSGSFKEKDADSVNDFFLDYLKPLKIDYKLTILAIAHNIKGKNKNYDDLDMIRGSGDISATLDYGLNLETISKSNLLLRQTKIRNQLKKLPFRISIDTDEKNFFKLSNEGYDKLENEGTRAEEILLDWLSKQKVGFQFKTKEALEILSKENIEKDSYYEALNTLKKEETIKKLKKWGYYELINPINKQMTIK